MAKKLRKLLDAREDAWNEGQKELISIRIKEKLNKGIRMTDNARKLLQNYKTWGGPCSSAEELQKALAVKPDISEKIVKNELTYYRNTHKTDVIARSELFRLINISHEKRLKNLLILLADESCDASSTSPVDLPTNDDVLNFFRMPVTIDDREQWKISSKMDCVLHYGKLMENVCGTLATLMKSQVTIVPLLTTYIELT